MALNKPVRKHHLEIDLHADSVLALTVALDELVFKLKTEQLSASIVSGGYDSGYTVSYHVDETMTHERFIEALNAYIESKRAGKAVTDETGDTAGIGE